ncbi:MAG: hypothetical protein ACR2GH_20185 [Pseudonocardia sp.]
MLVGAISEEPATLQLRACRHGGVVLLHPTGASDDEDLATLVGRAADSRLHPRLAHKADWSELAGTLDLLRDRKLGGGKTVLTVGGADET